MQSSKNVFIKAFPLFLVLFIDGMGLSLIMPILSALMFDPNSHFLSHLAIHKNTHNFIYGIINAIFMLCWFIGSAILGDLSDMIGRKKSLTICLTGAGLSYLLSAFAVISQSLSLLILGRVIGGLTSGSQPIAQAAIVDLSEATHKARNIGFILLALSLGFILGPLLGGILSDHHLVSWFDFSIPFYFAALISGLNIFLLMILFNEPPITRHEKIKIHFYKAVEIFISAFKHPQIKKLSVVYFIFIFGWSSYYSFIALFLSSEYHLSPLQISLFMAVMGIGFTIGTGFLIQPLTKRFKLKDCFKYTAILAAIFILIPLFFNQLWLNWVAAILIACFAAIAYSVSVTLFSDQVDADRQGWVMGVVGSIMALVWAINNLAVGLAAIWDVKSTMVIAAAGLLLSALIL